MNNIYGVSIGVQNGCKNSIPDNNNYLFVFSLII